MKCNVGGIDRAIRIILGLALIIAAATDAISWWGWLGVLVLASGVFSFCSLYSLLGVSTCPRK
ncbi:YgaP family membrane protein [Neisseria iguanae]|uniref:DUF2892 domain-containing protein n=1 Tax=Neisseria iguanae TaxID=90242 RepID=A0A2P7U1E5_9NEIS|nr:DUF2892 domain-containing protein [Neisseria iguanae]PSJ80796.1 DUF2892 domain-containing protein [Neisseria iguanae]